MIHGGKLDVVDVETGKPAGEGGEEFLVSDKAKVLLDLGVPAIVPIADGRAGKVAQEPGEIRFQRQFLDGFPIFATEFEAEFFRFRYQNFERFI